jgi:hypothetical protein
MIIALEYMLSELDKMPANQAIYAIDLRILLRQAIAVQKSYDGEKVGIDNTTIDSNRDVDEYNQKQQINLDDKSS